MVRSPVSPADSLVRRTIERYQATFNSGDRSGWLALFTDDGTLEDPVGSPPRRGRAALTAFWDEIHDGTHVGNGARVRMIQGPAVCGLDAAWAFELRIPSGDRTLVVEIIDEASFADDGRICRLRAFWNEGTTGLEG